MKPLLSGNISLLQIYQYRPICLPLKHEIALQIFQKQQHHHIVWTAGNTDKLIYDYKI